MALSPSATAASLRRAPAADAIAFVDRLLGAPSEWPSKVIEYRLSADFQADWKEQMGQWLKTADACGFLEPLLNKVLKRARKPTRSTGIDPNDHRYKELQAELAPAMTNHYFIGTGWRYGSWEPITGGAVDVDLHLFAPGGTSVYFQIKSPDLPGYIQGGRIVDGEHDNRIAEALTKAAAQLPTAGGEAKFIVICANRRVPLSGDPECVAVDLMGRSQQRGSIVAMPRASLGKFWTPEWKHVSGVVLLDYQRGLDSDGEDDFRYPCTVFVNPNADVVASESWFPYARVCVVDRGTFRWARGTPGNAHGIVDGMLIV